MKLAKAYVSWSEEKKNLFLLGCIGIAGFLILLCGFFLDNPGLPIGWLLGTVIEIVCYITIFSFARRLLDPNDQNGKHIGATVLFSLVRLLLYGGGLVLGAFCTYKWGTLAHGYCNLWTVFAAYMPMPILLLFVTFLRRPKKAKEAPKENGEGKQE